MRASGGAAIISPITTADDIVVLVRAAFADPDARRHARWSYDMARVELRGGDAVGTDAYPALRDARVDLVAALRSGAADVRMAAAYGLAFIVEHASEIQPALDAARDTAAMPLERAAMILAAARLRSSASQWRKAPDHPWDPVTLAPEAMRESNRAVKAAHVIAQLFAMSLWGRKVRRELADALAGLDGIEVGPWGEGDLARLASAMSSTLLVASGDPASVVYSATPPETHDEGSERDDALVSHARPVLESVPLDEPRHDAAGDDSQTMFDDPRHSIDPAEQAVIDEIQGANAAAEARASMQNRLNDADKVDHDDARHAHAPIDPAEQAIIDEMQAAIAAAEAAIASKKNDTDHDSDAEGDDDLVDRDVDDPYTQERPVRAAAPRVVLDGLRDVEWATLEHAYGTARGVPDMIDALSSPDRGDREWGKQALAASINHQGSVYSASGPAVPFLVKLVEREDIEDRAWILELLVGIAVGAPRWWLFHDLEDAATPVFDAVSAHGALFVRLVGARDSVIRSHAALAISFIRPPAGAVVAVKRALALETNRYARSSLLLALGYLGRRTRSTADRSAIERYLDDDCWLIATSAAIALAQIDRDACSLHARKVLAKAITDVPPVTGAWPWNGGNVAEFARIVRLCILSDDEMLDEADMARARGDWTSGRDYAEKVLVRLFRDGVHGASRLWVPSELDDRQRRVLRFLVAISKLHEGASAPQFPIDAQTAHSAGITANVEASKRLLGDARGALDRTIQCAGVLGGEVVPAWFAMDEIVGERASLDALRTAFSTIAPAERVEMVDDALKGPFALWHCRLPSNFMNPVEYQREKDYTSRFLSVAAALLVDAGLVGVAYAQRLAEEQLALARQRSTYCLVAAIVLATRANAEGNEPPAIVDRLVLTDQAPSGTYRVAIRAALDLLTPERRRRLLGDLPLYSYRAHIDPRGEARRWENERGWDLLDLLDPATIVAMIDAAWREWTRHRAAGDDSKAEPVRGYSKSNYERTPGQDEAFPIERAIAILDGTGELGRDLRDQLQRSTSAPTMSTSL